MRADVVRVFGIVAQVREHADGLGRRAARVLARIRLEESRPGYRAFDEALVHLGLGDLEGALDALERAQVSGHWWLVFLRVDPRFDPLHGDPRFERVAADLGL